jgi:hypothetical protein
LDPNKAINRSWSKFDPSLPLIAGADAATTGGRGRRPLATSSFWQFTQAMIIKRRMQDLGDIFFEFILRKRKEIHVKKKR